MHWYYADEGVQVGPLSESEFEDLVRIGKINDQTVVWHDGLIEWRPYGQIRKAPAMSAPPVQAPTAFKHPAPRCSECGNSFPQEELIRYQNSLVCTNCKPIFFQKVREGVAIPGTLNYAGFWIRCGAKIIDSMITGVVQLVIMLVFGPMLGFNIFSTEPPTNFSFLILYPFLFGSYIFYAVYFVGRFGATPGKMALGLKIVSSSGDPVSYGKAFARFFAEIVSGLICYVGYIMAAFNDERKTLHDQICDTRVIRK